MANCPRCNISKYGMWYYPLRVDGRFWYVCFECWKKVKGEEADKYTFKREEDNEG